MISDIIKKIFGDKSVKDQKAYQPTIEKVRAFESEFKALTTDQLRGKTVEFQSFIRNGIADLEKELTALIDKSNDLTIPVHEKEALYEKIDSYTKTIDEKIEELLAEILPQAFGVIKETSRRWVDNGELSVTAQDFDRDLATKKDGITIEGDKATWHNKWTAAGAEVSWNMVHYDVQLMGGGVLHDGKIAEMQTGEGKTLVATLPVYLNALAGKGVHLVTVNDYLAKRDSEWMGPLYQFHGLSVDCIDKHQPNSDARRQAYLADITFGTNNEFGFDYLRDNMAGDVDDLVQRKHHYAIVDEVDSVLIDDARTPLIISGPTPKGDEHEFHQLKPRVENIVAAQRQYVAQCLADAKKMLTVINEPVDDKKEMKQLLEDGGIALLRAHRGLPKNKALIKYLSEPGIRAHLQKTENFYMQEQGKQMKKIDKEVFFVIDEKNNTIELTDKGIDLISGQDDRDFFIMPDIGAEIAKIKNSGLEQEKMIEEKDRIIRDYSIKSERIHSINQLLKAYTLFEKEVEYVILEGKVKIVDESTGRIMEGRRYSDGLHQAIEAKENVTIEAATQTYATITLQNYFRMYHKLAGMTGTAETEAKEFWDIYELDVVVIPTNRPITRKDQNDFVFKTAREKFNAVIEETEKLVAAGRPVLVGTTTVEISEYLSSMLTAKKIDHKVLNAKQHKMEAEIVAGAGKAGAVTIATNMAGRGTDIKLGEGVQDAGGLAIIGTERHDSRRVDRQLRGRAGRQGDNGSSQFFVSLEDDLMRKFGSERIAKLMDRVGLKEGEVITHSMVSKSIERAQKKVEENQFGVRKRLLEYDDVMNSQREVVYKRRYNALFGERLRVDLANMIYDTSEIIVEDNKANNDYKNFEFELIRYFSMSSPVTADEFATMTAQEVSGTVYKTAFQHYISKMERNAELAFPVIQNVYETQRDKFKRIVVPFTDGVKSLQVVTDLEKAYQTNGKQLVTDFEKNISLAIIDDAWKTHLRKMDELKQSVQLAVHEQKDPLLIYKFESFELFKSMIDQVNKNVISFLFKGEIPQETANVIQEAKARRREKTQTSKENIQNLDERSAEARAAGNTERQPQVVETIVRDQPKIGRNDRVTIKHVMSGEKKTTKFKQAEPLIAKGEWVLINE